MEKVLVLFLLIILLIIAMAFNSARVETRLEDSTKAWSAFPEVGHYRLRFYRQSGNHHKNLYILNGTKESVEDEVKKVFSRAKIGESYMVSTYKGQVLYERAYAAYSPRGKRYSKGVGSCYVEPITLPDGADVPKKKIVTKSITFTITDTETGTSIERQWS